MIATSIAASAEQQGGATLAIACDVQRNSEGTRDMTGNISGVSSVVEQARALGADLVQAADQVTRQSN